MLKPLLFLVLAIGITLVYPDSLVPKLVLIGAVGAVVLYRLEAE